MKIDQLTFTRFIAAIGIVIFHFGRTVFPFNDNHLQFIFNHANIGVSYFFILSGFVMVIAYYKKDTKIDSRLYYRNRVARIYPLYVLAFILSILFLPLPHFDLVGLVLECFALQAWIPKYTLGYNLPAWSLSVEAFFYLLFPFLVNSFYLKFNVKSICFIGILIWLCTQLFFLILPDFSFYNGRTLEINNLLFYSPLMHLNQFLIGNIGGLIYLKIVNKKTLFQSDLSIIALIMIAVVCGALIRFHSGSSINSQIAFHDGLLAIITLPLIISLSLNKGLVKKIFSSKQLVFLGDISYGIYILQYPMYAITLAILKKINITDPSSIFFLSVIILILASAFFYIAIEVPFRKWIKNKHTIYSH